MIAIVLLDLTRRMSKAILKVSTVAYARSVWGEVNTNLLISDGSPFKWKSGCGIIITNDPIFLWECNRRSRSRCDILKCTMRRRRKSRNMYSNWIYGAMISINPSPAFRIAHGEVYLHLRIPSHHQRVNHGLTG